jgi:dolichyl-phosphate-mannose--protein O-mannosyl transferase
MNDVDKNDTLVITEENFGEYFFDIRTHKPQRGQVMACYTATAEFLDGMEKRNIMAMLQGGGKVESICQVMRKLLHAHDADAIRVPRQITEDLIAGMSHDEIAKKKYRYTVEVFFYTQPEYIPTDDPHWSSVSLLNLNQFIDKEDDNDDDNGLIVKSKIITN